jgi:hypothetical protein
MDKKPIPYDYKGEQLLIYPGHLFQKKELILRLKEMNFAFVDTNYKKQDLVTLYEIATSYKENIEKIIEKIKKDNQYMKLKENLRQNSKIDYDDNNINNILHNLKRKFLFNDNNSISNLTEDNDKDNTVNSSNSSSFSISSFFSKLLMKLLSKNKFNIFKFVIMLIFVYGLDYLIPRNFDNLFLIGTLLNKIREAITPKRMILFFLGIYVLSIIINSMFYLLFGIGVLIVLSLIFKYGNLKDLFPLLSFE